MSQENDIIELIFAGDFIPPEENSNIFSSNLLTFLKDKDFSIVNLETPLTDSKNYIKKTGRCFKKAPVSVKHIKDGFFNAVALANNHIRDYGDQGVLDTIEVCMRNGIKTVGAGMNLHEALAPLRITIKGKKIAVLNYSEREFNIASKSRAGANPYDIISAYWDLKKEKSENDYVIVIYHGGLEYHTFPLPGLKKKLEFMIEIGADAVICHHTHQISGYSFYKDKPIFFSLGNFFMPTTRRDLTEWRKGILLKLKLVQGKVEISPVLVIMDEDFTGLDLACGEFSESVLHHVEDVSKKLLDEEFLKSYWNSVNTDSSDMILSQLKSETRIEYRLRKKFAFLARISKYRAMILLNLIRCDSHRERLIKVLERNSVTLF